MILLRDGFRIDLVISPRVADLAWCETERKYSYSQTNKYGKSSRNDKFIN